MQTQVAAVPTQQPSIRLTPREREVLALLCAGLCNKSIARELGISLGTVKVHVAAILKALRVSTRMQAVLVALKAGLPQASMIREDASAVH